MKRLSYNRKSGALNALVGKWIFIGSQANFKYAPVLK